MRQVQLLIGRRDVDAGDGSTFERRNPISGDIVTVAAAAGPADALAAADAALEAFPAWSSLGPGARRGALMRAAEAMESQAAALIDLMGEETGATPAWGQFNVALAAGMLREAAAMCSQIQGEVLPSDVPGNLALAVRQPAGVVLGCAPWNAPLILGVRALAMPLACGNTVILKASERCPGTHRLIGALLREAGLGGGIVNVITHAREAAPAVAEALIAHRAVRRVNFTGSTAVGRGIALLAARYLKPVLLELGGKAPLIVLADADLDAAVDATVFGAFANQGQICMSTERVIVEEPLGDEFARRLAARVAALPAGDPAAGSVVLGPLVDAPAAERVRRLVDAAVDGGARLLVGGGAHGTVLAGMVVDRVTPDMALFHEESFGPQVSITRVHSDEEALRLANDSEYGLAAAVFSRDIARALQLARRIDSGICHINGPTVHDEAHMPFGGTKSSGYGRFGGRAAIEQFTELRWISIQTTPRHYPF
jgi:acyl-CoA reductase-like NAD-dependent aldehyde dehydrogenase